MFWLSPTFDALIADTINRFKETYPGVDVKWEDHQATFQDDLKNAFNAGNGMDVINLSVGEGWVSDYATRDLLLPLDSVSQEEYDSYFEGLWKSQNVDGKNYQFPFYQGVSVELINKRHFRGRRPRSGRLPDQGRGAAGAVPDPEGEGERRLRHPPDRQRPARADGLRGQRQGPVRADGSASRSTRPTPFRGCRCRHGRRRHRRQHHADDQGRPRGSP